MTNIPYHKHDSESSVYLGSEIYKGKPYDYYFALQSVGATVIARYGENWDYISGLLLVKTSLDKSKDTVSNLNEMINSYDESLALLGKATLLSINKGLLDENLKVITPKRPKP